MPRPWRIIYNGAKYHIYSRGNGKQQIFFAKKDYERFLEQLLSALEKDRVTLYAYCLMPNHYHLFVETPLGNIHKFEQRLNTAYGMYYRYKYQRPGHCFQGRYGCKVVGGNDYVLRLTRYIHMNPAETTFMKRKTHSERQSYVHEYQWSSFRGYIRKSFQLNWIDYRWLALMDCRTQTGNRLAYRAYVDSMIGETDEVLNEAFTASKYAIGNKAFIEEAEEELKQMRLKKKSFSDFIFSPNECTEIQEIQEVVAEKYGISTDELRAHGRHAGVAKNIAVELSCMLSGKTQREIAKHFGFRTDAGITRQRRILKEKIAEDTKLEEHIRKITKTLERRKNKK
ncbi:MAG: transposase [Kiritimatiellia bacterium]